MRTEYQVQQLDGYTDGKPSWRKIRTGVLWGREDAETHMAELKRQNPARKFRIRKVIRK